MLKKAGKIKISKRIEKKINYSLPSEVIESTVEQIVDFLVSKIEKKEDIIINNFGTITVYKRHSQHYYNVGLKQKILRPEYWSVKIIPHENFKRVTELIAKNSLKKGG